MSQINTTFAYNGVEYYFDIEDIECTKKYEEAFDQLSVAEKLLKKDGKKSEYIMGYCEMIRGFFNNLFGKDAAVAICGEKLNSRTDTEAYDAFLAFVAEQTDAGLQAKNEIALKYANRAQRRAAAKAAKNGTK